MLSASTISSTSSSAFSTTGSFGILTPSSQHSIDSQKQIAFLNEIAETEQRYMETLNMIDSQVAPTWMKQMTSAAPDFSELLKHIHDIIKANKRFYIKLTRMIQNPQAMNECSEVLIQWVNDLEVPYANYCRSYIPNLNERTDIFANSFVSKLLHDLSANASYEITLESLFNAPIQQLKYYKSLYSRLLDGIDYGTHDHKLLTNANKRIDTILLMSQKTNRHVDLNAKGSFSFLQVDIDSELRSIESQVDCSSVADLFKGTAVNYKQLRISNPGSKLVMRDSFIMLSSEQHGSTTRVHLILTTEVLVVCLEQAKQSYSLMYPPIPIGDVVVKAEALEREIVGEYIIQLSVTGHKHLIIRADSKEIRNTWVGVDQNSPKAKLLSPRPLNVVAQKKMLSSSMAHNKCMNEKQNSSVRNTDIFTYYSENGGVSPLDSSDEEEEDDLKTAGNSRDTIMDLYDNHLTKQPEPSLGDSLANVTPQSVKILPQVPNVAQAKQATTMHPPNKGTTNVKSASPIKENASHPVKDAGHVQMTYIEAPTAKMGTLTISNTSDKSPSLSSSSPKLAGTRMNAAEKPSSPRAIEVQRAVVPEIMQAVTQNTNEYLAMKDKMAQNTSAPAAARAALQQTVPRTSSMRNHVHKPLPQHPLPLPGQNHPPSTYNHNGQVHSNQPSVPQNGNRPVYSSPMNTQKQQPNFRPQQNNNRPMNAPPPPNHQNFRPHNGAPSPYQQQARPYNGAPPHQQPARPQFNAPSPSLSHAQMNNSSDEWNSPPHSPSAYITSNSIKQVLYSNNQCEVFHWNNQSWYAADGQCLLQVRLTHNNRTCMAVELQNTGQLYLNAWILPTTVIKQPSPTDISISVYMGTKKETYLVHFPQPQDATALVSILYKAHQESNQPLLPSPEPMADHDDEIEPVDNVNCPQTLKPVMQCKAKLFVQNETNNWSTLGSVTMRISQQSPSMRMMIQIENDKTKLVSAIVRSGNVEKISSKRISFLLSDEAQKTSIVYMIHLREEQTGNKIYEYLRIKNAENGW
ncbi:hypothetical protein BCV72DRAFT_210266 [Rhizopus microsporus var. microsporus]|uniref:DH domain-containing protein n=1 Tax=Rhizopus microsporus var. microsporus TaxID=86635 RepID=A0A1X0QYY0_RHIZD|nr:hypothetical protein BCV72DRAFT_210266 [Rhizopus microsporus var. microsporus]